MIQERLISELLLQISNCDFKEAWLLLSKNISKQSGIDSSKALKVVASCCKTCSKNMFTLDKIDNKYLCEVLNNTVQFIKISDDAYIENYLRALYHILKFLFAKDSLEYIVTLDKLLIPEFMPNVLSAKACNLYQTILQQSYNVFVVKSKSNDQNQNVSLIKLAEIMALMCKKIQNQTLLLHYSYNCNINLIRLENEPKRLVSFYLFALELLVKPENDFDDFKQLVNHFSLMFTAMIRSREFDNAIDCHNKTLETLKILVSRRELLYLSDILEICKWCVPSYQPNDKLLTNCHSSLKKSYQLLGLNDNLLSVCNAISNVVGVIVEYYKSNPQEWIKRGSERLQMEFFRFTYTVAQILSKCPFECACKSGCKSNNVIEAIKLINYTTDLGKLVIHNKVEVSQQYKTELSKYFEKNLEYLSLVKNCSCDAWQKNWHSIGHRLYNISTNLYHNNDESAVIFLTQTVKALLQFEGKKEILGSIYLPCCLNVLAEIHLKAKDYERSLAYTSFVVAFASDQPTYLEDSLKLWTRTKFTFKEEDIFGDTTILETTIPEICDKFKHELFNDHPDFIISNEKRIELLKLELDSYKKTWKSKVPMMAAYKHLMQLADVWTAAKIFVDVWSGIGTHFHFEIPKLIEDTIKKCEKDSTKTNIRDKICLAHLYYLHHCSSMVRIVVKNSEEMLEAQKVEADRENGSVDESDIVSSYQALRLSQYINTMKSLNKALSILTVVVTKLKSKSMDISKLFNLLQGIAYEFRLHGHSINSLQAAELALKVAVIANENILIVKSTGCIIELFQTNSKELKTLVDRADAIVDGLNLEDNLEEFVAYNLSKASAHLHVNFDVAYKSFQKLYEIRERFEENIILKIKLLMLYHKLIMLPCELDVQGHNEHSLVKISEAYNISVQHYSAVPDPYKTPFMCLFFDVSEEVARMYHSLRMPRELRCYGKEVLLIAQKMVLPFRSLTFLYYLALADINSNRYNDCKVKVSGFSDILCFSKGRAALTDTRIQQSPVRLEYAVTDLVEDFGGITLDVSKKMVYQQVSPSSPKLRIEGFKVPTFIHHLDDCECFYCTSLECFSFLLKKTYLDGLVNLHGKNTGLAREFFNGGAKLFKIFQMKDNSFSKKFGKKLCKDLVPILETANIETYAYLLLEFGNILLRSNNVSDSKAINTKLLHYLKPIKLNHLYLYNEGLAQKLNIFATLATTVSKPKTVLVEAIDFGNCVKTPETKMSKVVVSSNFTSNLGTSPPPKRTVKGIRFDLSDNEDESSAESKKNRGPNDIMRTPAPVMSFKDLSSRTTRKKKTVSVISSVSSNQPSSESLIAMSPDAYNTTASKPIGSKVETTFAKRTKLLTERLKSSCKKSQIPTICVSTSNSGNSSNQRDNAMANVRKNLLSDLEEGPRRSKRNAK